MGINGLNKFLKNNCPEVFEEIHLSEFAFKKVAIDISLYLCKFKAVCGDRWLKAFVNLIACLRKNEIHCVMIYDTGSPPEKTLEKAERALHKKKLQEKLFLLDEAINHYHLTNEVLPELTNLKSKIEPRRLLSKTSEKFNIKDAEETVNKIRKQIISISPEDFNTTKKLFTILKVPYYNAPLEAETICADLCKKGLVDGVLSEDTDVLAYSSPIFLTKIETTTNTCIQINHKKVLEQLKLTNEEFLDLCIMCGTDYNKNIPKVASETAFKYIKKYSNIETLSENTSLDISILNHTRVREIFKDYETIDITIPFCGQPDFDELHNFLIENNILINIEFLKTSFSKNVIIFK